MAELRQNVVELRKQNIVIRGVKWRISLIANSDFDAAHGSGTAAITEADKKTITFQPGQTSIVTVRHELFHAYMAESYLNDINLKAHGLEEAAAEVVGNFLTNMNRQSNRIFKFLNG